METQNWTGMNPSAEASTTAVPPPPAALRYDLRPLSVGEILDRVLSIYRSHFWLLAGLSAVSGGVTVAIQILRLIVLDSSRTTVGSPAYAMVLGGFAIIEGVLYIVAYSLTVAATTSAVNAIYLGEPTSIPIALRTARRLWLRCMGIAIWQGWSAGWVAIAVMIPFFVAAALPGVAGFFGAALAVFLFIAILASIVYGVIAYLRNSLAVPAAVVEDLKVRAAMRRSKRLASGRVGRIFLLMLLVYALWMVATIVQVPLTLVLLKSQATERFALQAITLVVNFVCVTAVGPIAAIGLCLFYFDERVRREGFDIEILLRDAMLNSPEVAGGVPQAPVETPEVAQPAPEHL